MGIGDVFTKLFKNDGLEKKNKDKINIDTLIEPPKAKAEQIFLYKTIDFEDISIKEKE
ncbi:MAG: hypothetical protein GTO02_05605 [Candidatus Dadabacteria bacterium]|nr:hypothetical protein [Candidatus Dadabacteria bacterium]NIQ13882.1 hypothetical protein [Candidatus Dadabacteria bacterium]